MTTIDEKINLNITGEDLKLLIDHLKDGGVAGSGNFKQVVENGILTLYNNNIKIMEQADDGTWVRTGLYTGANSIHLGGTGTTGSKSHTLTVGGQNVVFINEWSAVGGNRVAFSPAWEGISCDGETVLESSTRIYEPLSAYEPAGAPSNPNGAGNIVPCTYETTALENLVAFDLVVIAKEAYTGRVYATIESNFVSSQGSELSGQYEMVMTTDNGALNFTFETPYWLNNGDKLKISLLKEDGTPLQVLKGTTGQPWRMHNVRRFEFKPLALKDDLNSKVDKVDGKQLSDENFTTPLKEKVLNLEPNWRGSFLLSSELLAAYPTPQAGWGAWVYETNTLWAVKEGAWDNTGGSSFGNMNTELYDPQGIAADAFNRANHTGALEIVPRTFSITGKYKAGEVVYKSNEQLLYRCVSDLDGTVTPISFVVGTLQGQFTPLDAKYPESISIYQKDSADPITSIAPATDGVLVTVYKSASNKVEFKFDGNRKRLTSKTDQARDTLSDDDYLQKGDADSLYLTEAPNTIPIIEPHDISAKYKHGQQAYYDDVEGNRFLVRANSDIDGTLADVEFAEGNDGQLNTWTKIANLSSSGDTHIQQAHFVLAASTNSVFIPAFTHNGFKFEVRNFMTSITKVRFTKERLENIVVIWKSISGTTVASNTTESSIINWSGHAEPEKLRYINVTVCDKESNKVLHKYDITTADIENSGNGQVSISIVSQAFA